MAPRTGGALEVLPNRAIRVPLMTLPFVSYKSVRHAVNRPPLTGSRDALHQALIARVVLGPCKAFDAAPGKDGLANQ